MAASQVPICLRFHPEPNGAGSDQTAVVGSGRQRLAVTTGVTTTAKCLWSRLRERLPTRMEESDAA
jgi:hypothetical protein